MKLINADKLEKDVLKWMPPDPCGQEEKEHPFEEDICVSMMLTIDEQEPIDAIPCDFIWKLIHDPNNIGTKSYVLLWLLKEWENESKRVN